MGSLADRRTRSSTRAARAAGSCAAALAAVLSLSALPTEALAAGVAPGAATPVQREQAQSRFLRGRTLYAAKKYDDAYKEFAASLDIVASPNTRLYAGRCLRETGHLVQAYVELGRTEVEAKELTRDDPRYERTGAAAAEERNQLASRLGFVDLRVTNAEPETTVTVGGDDVKRGGWDEPIPAVPGSVDVVVRTPGREPVTRTVTVSAGKNASVAVDARADAPSTEAVAVAAIPTEAPEHGKGLRPYAFLAGGVAVAGLATFTVFGLMANGTHADLEKACGSGPCPPGHEDEISSGRTQQTIANIGLVVGAIGAAAAVTLFVLDARGSSSSDASATPAAVFQPRARVVARGSFLGLEGTF